MLASRSLRLACFALATIVSGVWVRSCRVPAAKPPPITAPFEIEPPDERNPDE
ncbi:MAG: hypothetical protein JNG86_07160 [Verrucomicrobiaceae bacterium]|nr:hypothetical protein [Verrucomicrobiaceae bacterium]